MVNIFSVGGLLLAFFLVFMNGFFVAAEFSLVKIRSTQVEALVEEGKPGASLVQEITSNLDDYLAVCQLGITLSSLGLGWIGEPAVATLIEPIVGSFIPSSILHVITFGLSFGFITFLHVVFGELAPKTFAIQEAAKISVIVALPMKFFYYIFMPGIFIFNGTANYFTSLLGVSSASEHEDTHTEEEIRMILATSQERGQINMDEVEMIESIFELGDTIAREIMIPRPDVETVSSSMSFSDLKSYVAEGPYTRYLVLDDSSQKPIGFVHAKDILREDNSEDKNFDSLTARDLAQDILVVPETRRVDEILEEFQKSRKQIAVVIDEWGVFEGIITIEDILEEIVGEIRDEFDRAGQEYSIKKQDDSTYIVDGAVPVQEVNETLNTQFDTDEVETIGGFVFSHIGHTPEVGDKIEKNGYILKVDEVKESRIMRLIIKKSEKPNDSEKSASST